MPEGVFLHAASKVLLVLHAAAAVVTIGAATHHGWLSVQEVRSGVRRADKQRLYVAVLAVAYLATFVLGTLVYPAFRVYVRAAYFDTLVPLATGFFEIKEHWLAVGLALLVVQVSLSRAGPDAWGALERRVFAVNSWLLTLVVWLGMLTGFVLTALRPV